MYRPCNRRRFLRTLIGAIVALAVVAVVVATQLAGQTREVTSGRPGLFRDPPFSVRLDGPLWRARTLRDGEGAQDFALVARDLPLNVRASGSPAARVAQVELRVDGRRQRLVVPRCLAGRCPVGTRVTFVPRLRKLPPGDHRVEILVRDPAGTAASADHGEHVTANGFDVRSVTRIPATGESRTITKLPAPALPSRAAVRLRRSALAVLSAARRAGGVADALGGSRVTVRQVGPLSGARLGVTMLVALVPPRYKVSAIVPSYVPAPFPGGVAYTGQQVRMRAAVLRDVLVDVDLATRRVISVEPGPRSRTLSWSPSKAPAPAGASDED
jgi:hypothetical protein